MAKRKKLTKAAKVAAAQKRATLRERKREVDSFMPPLRELLIKSHGWEVQSVRDEIETPSVDSFRHFEGGPATTTIIIRH